MLTMLEFIQNQKWLVLLCTLSAFVIAGIAVLRKAGQEPPRLFYLVYGLYLFWLGLGILWACSGKFILREYSKQLLVLPLMLYVFFLLPRKESAIRRLLFLMSAMGAFFALLSVDIASARLSAGLLSLLPGFGSEFTGFESGTRLTSVFSNGNISAGLLALCIFLSLYLLESAENRRQRIFAAVFASLQAVTFLLNFSLGASAFFLVSVVVYLVFAGETRSSVFLRMLEIALPAIIAVFISFRFFEVTDGRRVIPLAAAVLSAAAAAALELAVFPKLSERISSRKKLAACVFAAVAAVLVVYAALGLLFSGEAELGKRQSLRRSCYPEAGEYSLVLNAEGTVNVRIVSQNEREVVMHTETVLYSGAAEEAVISVPEDSKVVYLTFTTADHAVLREADLRGPETVSIHLGYPLLPGFISNRLQGLRANENAIQRLAFFRDGMKVFRDHPILGAGLGCFETLLFGYQDFYYETKYVHNHYIQVLLDSGIVGLILYLALLALSAAALWRGRKQDSPNRRLHPALCAAFAMIVLHSSMEVVMSTSVYLPYACVLLGLIAVCFAAPMKHPGSGKAAAAISGTTALVYAVLIVLNLQANSSIRQSTGSPMRFFNAIEKAVKTDVFEKNDWKVSYINSCSDLETAAYRPQADRYAQQLIDVPSNSLHQYLLNYYLSFRDYEHALAAAKKSVGFNYSNSANWNICFSMFSDALSSHPEDSEAILGCVYSLNEELHRYEERLMEPVKLNSVSASVIAAATKE